ncbi:hypothetical protein PHLCEN_2v3981 [Hermanssonia centrifuga]|uniref:Uncharacterized protein n=1 Tax=Hermanssonia centrifuga TaxID=98765 RepID=A0A2R6Q7I4_9APHY|nr:hypothetical protein PHLCEN_2v3981 [Hermanssonia centrifuga]
MKFIVSQSFPTLIVIGTYERYLAQGQRLRQSGSDAAHSFYNSFSRRVKYVPFLERLVGTSTTDLYDAIFDVDASHGLELFGDSDDEAERTAWRAQISQESLRPPSPSSSRHPSSARRTRSVPHSPDSRFERRRRVLSSTTTISPRRRPAVLSTFLEPSSSAEIQTVGPRSPLSRLFNGRGESSQERLHSLNTEAAMKKLENLVEEIRHLPVNKLKEEMKELQDRQARIENLLLMLTRGMRNETGPKSTVRNDTM